MKIARREHPSRYFRAQPRALRAIALGVTALGVIALSGCELPARKVRYPSNNNNPQGNYSPHQPGNPAQPNIAPGYQGPPVYPAQPGNPAQPGSPAQPNPPAQPGLAVKWVQVPPNNARVNPLWGPKLIDLMQRQSPHDGGQIWEDLTTTAHEVTHGITFDLYLQYSREAKNAGFYTFNGRAAIVDEPNILKSHVAQLIPPSLRGSRFDTYLVRQTGWDKRPLYVWNEWNAYINGAEVAIERFLLGLEPAKPFSTNDRIYSVLEFTAYSLALVLTVRTRDPQYLQRHPQFKEFFAWNTERAMRIVQQGRGLAPFIWGETDRAEQTLRSHPEAEPLRQVCREQFGPAWCQRTFGF